MPEGQGDVSPGLAGAGMTALGVAMGAFALWPLLDYRRERHPGSGADSFGTRSGGTAAVPRAASPGTPNLDYYVSADSMTSVNETSSAGLEGPEVMYSTLSWSSSELREMKIALEERGIGFYMDSGHLVVNKECEVFVDRL